jgi:hypothetical protein
MCTDSSTCKRAFFAFGSRFPAAGISQRHDHHLNCAFFDEAAARHFIGDDLRHRGA